MAATSIARSIGQMKRSAVTMCCEPPTIKPPTISSGHNAHKQNKLKASPDTPATTAAYLQLRFAGGCGAGSPIPQKRCAHLSAPLATFPGHPCSFVHIVVVIILWSFPFCGQLQLGFNLYFFVVVRSYFIVCQPANNKSNNNRQYQQCSCGIRLLRFYHPNIFPHFPNHFPCASF